MSTRKKISENNDKIQQTCFVIGNLANAFERTGNYIVAEELREHVEQISKDSEGMLNAYDKETSEAFDATMKQIGKTLSACVNAGEQ